MFYKVVFYFALTFTFLSSSLAEERYGDLLGCENIIDIKDHRGQTFLSFMSSIVKPELDYFAKKGYVVRHEALVSALESVDAKVRRKALRGGKDIEGLEKLSEALKGQTVNLYTLPDLILGAGREYARGRYNLSTYIGLASCGGAVVKFYDDNYAYNIHYGTGEVEKDERTGRSFGAGPGRMANDASDKAYLRDLEEYLTHESKNVSEFYKGLLMTLTNTDTSNYSQISDFGQFVLTDFLAVYIAEQDRNLMDGKVYPHWDAALLEVTLIGVFHAGQKEIKMFYKNPDTKKTTFTTDVFDQQPACKPREGQSVRKLKNRKARLLDYWQFSQSGIEENCRRSGINITKKQFRKLGAFITSYEEEHHPELVKNVKRHLKVSKRSRSSNVFYELSKYLISSKAEKSLEDNGKQLTEDYGLFLEQIRKDAPAITKALEAL